MYKELFEDYKRLVESEKLRKIKPFKSQLTAIKILFILSYGLIITGIMFYIYDGSFILKKPIIWIIIITLLLIFIAIAIIYSNIMGIKKGQTLKCTEDNSSDNHFKSIKELLSNYGIDCEDKTKVDEFIKFYHDIQNEEGSWKKSCHSLSSNAKTIISTAVSFLVGSSIFKKMNGLDIIYFIIAYILLALSIVCINRIIGLFFDIIFSKNDSLYDSLIKDIRITYLFNEKGKKN